MASKKDKIRKLFENSNTPRNTDVKYADAFNEFIIPFRNDFSESWDWEFIFYFALNAWNMGNLKMVIPEKDFNRIIAPRPGEDIGDINIELLKKMVDYKISHYNQYDRFITKFNFTGEEIGKQVLTVKTENRDTFVEMKDSDIFGGPYGYEYYAGEFDFEESYIDRYAVVLKPKQPFLDWVNSFITGERVEKIEEANIYLVDEDIEDLEKWLKKKYDKLFTMELDEWFSSKCWPQKRTYKMFRQWFQVDISTMIYDLEKRPITKE
ncbi:hypothetical protein ED312_03655 [Sinomicrobium pectinilyticum]|uniref:Uncharacterized protein n=1 Tax=Sinomicrobium pectinilyticum TaxID=1084421 RepID=A0A3N0EWI5_SINP1|nr:hypothetical protein [Sinomicrobium pectinilyticum]RNL92268.1 hypothetical protein ED312_03655 [Sinomicrobium pectinilyticum]